LLESLFEHPVRQLDAFAHRASAWVLLDKIEFFNSLLGFDVPDSHAATPCAQDGRRHPLELHHHRHLIWVWQAGQLAPAFILGSQESQHHGG
jgi:hypothetical protein